jgi:hypothetical protein
LVYSFTFVSLPLWRSEKVHKVQEKERPMKRRGTRKPSQMIASLRVRIP